MQCFVCRHEVIPEKGYFKTSLWNGNLICHQKCQPTFYWDNKPIKENEHAEASSEEVARDARGIQGKCS